MFFIHKQVSIKIFHVTSLACAKRALLCKSKTLSVCELNIYPNLIFMFKIDHIFHPAFLGTDSLLSTKNFLAISAQLLPASSLKYI